MSLLRNAASILATQTVTIPLRVVSGIVLARYLSMDDRGQLAIAMSLGALVTMVSQVGWPSAAIYRIRRLGSDPARVAATGVAAVLAFSGLTLAVCLLMRHQLVDGFMRGAPLLVLYLALGVVPFDLLGNIFSAIARALDRFSLQNAYRLSLAAGRLTAFGLVLILLSGQLLDVLAVSIAVSGMAAVGLALSVLRLTGTRSRPDREEFFGTLRFGAKGWTHALAGNVHARANLFMLAYLLQDSSEVALFAIGAGVANYLYLFPEAIAVSALPQIAGAERTEASRLAAATLRNTIPWVILSVLVAAPLAPFLLPWVYGTAYTGSIGPLLVLLPAVPLQTLYRILARYFVAVDHQRVNILLVLGSTLLNIVLNLVLIPRYGIVGAAFASLISHAVEGIAVTVVFIAMTDCGVREVLILGRGDLASYRQRLRGALRRLRRSQ
jgi:O-antigen/teichoic acid export membrane protein